LLRGTLERKIALIEEKIEQLEKDKKRLLRERDRI